MGRQAKLKKLRHSQPAPSAPEAQPQLEAPTQFVRQLEREGYQLDGMTSSPDVPPPPREPKRDPQV